MSFTLSRMSNSKDAFQTRMWANAQRDGHPDKYRWHPLFNAAQFGLTPTTSAVQNPLKFAGVAQTTGLISDTNEPKFAILCRHVEEVSLLKFLFDCRYVP